MSKRILSMFVILAILMVSLPIMPLSISAETSSTYNKNLSILTVDNVINSFDDAYASGQVTVGDKTVNVGIGTNNTEYTVNDYSARPGNYDKNTLTIENGVLKDTIKTKSPFAFYTYITPVSPTRGYTMPTKDTIALQFHVDFTNITTVSAGSKVSFEVQFYRSTGKSSGTTIYSVPDETFLYIPDPTNENPNPETQVLTTGGGVQVYHGSVWGYAGQSGTIVMPLDVWDTDKLNNYDIWSLYTHNQGYHHRSYININTNSTSYNVGDVFAIDDICWMKKNTKTYDYEVNAQDFNEITTANLDGWTHNNTVDWAKGTNFTVTDGKLKLTKTCEKEGRSISIFPIVSWNEKYAAFEFDFDASEMINATTLGTSTGYIRMGYRVDKTATTAATSCWYNGGFKYVWEDGSVTNATAHNNGTAIPKGFKGKIVVPASTVQLSDAVKAGIKAGAQSRFHLELVNLVAGQKDTSVYVDNFKFYYNADSLDDTAGTDFSKLETKQYETVKPVTEDIRTIEAFFKTDTKLTQGILGTKFGDASYHGMNAEITMVATGQLVLTIGNNRMTITDRSLNDNCWHHVALTADDTNMKLSCYVDGQLVKETALTSLTFSKNTDFLPLTIGNSLPAESKFYTVFEGKIANVRLWNDVRTAEEIDANKMISVGADAEGLIAEWMLDSENITVDTTGNYPLKTFYWNIDKANALYEQYNRDSAEDEFTILFFPDTQTLIKDFKDDVPTYFDWIIANAERLNVKAVVSLGDIIERKAVESEYITLSEQYARLTAAGIPAVCTIGDHDYYDLGTRDTRYYSKYFTPDLLVENDEFKLGGLYEEGSLLNGYYYLHLKDGSKFMIMNLEVHARDIVLDWANEVVAAHPDYRVMVATHNYMSRPYGGRYITTGYENYPLHKGNAGEAVWQKFLSQHKNIEMLLCGHSETSGYWYTYDTGVHGNRVIQINCDLQNTDQSYKTLGAVLIGRFKKTGGQVTFNLYSTNSDLFIDSNCNDRTHILEGIVENNNVADVNGVKYDNLSDALNNANGETVTILSDITTSEQIVITDDIVLDLNDCELNLTYTDGAAIDVKGNLTITGNGTLKLNNFTGDGEIVIESSSFNIDVSEYLAEGSGLKAIDGVYTAAASAVIADADEDGNVSATDISYFRNKVLGDIVDTKYFDVNGDGVYNALDIVRTKKISVDIAE